MAFQQPSRGWKSGWGELNYKWNRSWREFSQRPIHIKYEVQAACQWIMQADIYYLERCGFGMIWIPFQSTPSTSDQSKMLFQCENSWQSWKASSGVNQGQTTPSQLFHSMSFTQKKQQNHTIHGQNYLSKLQTSNFSSEIHHPCPQKHTSPNLLRRNIVNWSPSACNLPNQKAATRCPGKLSDSLIYSVS